ncbi:hypothetical protein CCACVL1_17978 [Corchorus capsularis]|uniref:Uncharacterized protein n=1 Tax=Corchorus capsularis TaxID=210143 RepID=A0A1R3HNU8_COCAP|nr:hypothetical protein CCACVL1_17978 [Corchorus capsularis]
MNVAKSLLLTFMLIAGTLLSHNIHLIAATKGVPGSSFDGRFSHNFPSKFKYVLSTQMLKPGQPPPPPPKGATRPQPKLPPSAPPPPF